MEKMGGLLWAEHSVLLCRTSVGKRLVLLFCDEVYHQLQLDNSCIFSDLECNSIIFSFKE